MGEIYEAVQQALKRRVAIKILASWACHRADLRSRFLQEGEAAARFRHNNIVSIYDVGSWNGRPYIVMEFLVGENLETHIHEAGIIREEEIANILLPILSAVAAAHDRGVVHRDLKPSNIFLAELESGVEPKVLDFGISRVMTTEERITMHAEQIGTPHYMAPEQARGEDVDGRADQYSLGVLLYEMATGVLPRDDDSPLRLIRAVSDATPFPKPREVFPPVSEMLERVILRAMADDPNDRYLDLRDLAMDLVPLASPHIATFWRVEAERTSSRPLAPAAERTTAQSEALTISPNRATPSPNRVTPSPNRSTPSPTVATAAPSTRFLTTPFSAEPPVQTRPLALRWALVAAVLLVATGAIVQWVGLTTTAIDVADLAEGPDPDATEMANSTQHAAPPSASAPEPPITVPRQVEPDARAILETMASFSHAHLGAPAPVEDPRPPHRVRHRPSRRAVAPHESAETAVVVVVEGEGEGGDEEQTLWPATDNLDPWQ